MDKTRDDVKKSAIGLKETIGIYFILILGFYLLGEFDYLDERTTEAFAWLIILSIIVIVIIRGQIFVFRDRFKTRKSNE